MNKLAFEFSEEMMTIALLANGWSEGWKTGDWVSPSMNADCGGYSLKEAFSRLLLSKNLVGENLNDCWRVK